MAQMRLDFALISVKLALIGAESNRLSIKMETHIHSGVHFASDFESQNFYFALIILDLAETGLENCFRGTFLKIHRNCYFFLIYWAESMVCSWLL